MIPARNTIDAHAQDFVGNDELLLSNVSALAHYTLLEMLDVFSLCVVEQSVAPTSSSPVIRLIVSSPPHRANHAYHSAGICGL
jgi:hypothetical protein